MSAWIVNREHIIYLVKAAKIFKVVLSHTRFGRKIYRFEEMSDDTLLEFAQTIYNENVKSVSSRYPDDPVDELPGPTDGTTLTLKDVTDTVWNTRAFDPVQVIKSADCYDYQSCEHDDYEKSLASDFIKTLISHATGKLDGYDGAEWGRPDPDEWPDPPAKQPKPKPATKEKAKKPSTKKEGKITIVPQSHGLESLFG